MGGAKSQYNYKAIAVGSVCVDGWTDTHTEAVKPQGEISPPLDWTWAVPWQTAQCKAMAFLPTWEPLREVILPMSSNLKNLIRECLLKFFISGPPGCFFVSKEENWVKLTVVDWCSLRRLLKKLQWPGVVAHTCNHSTLEGRGRQIMRSGVQDGSGQPT